MKNAVIYARVSTTEQAEKGKSIETQLKIAKKWAKDNDYKVISLYVDEGKSATNLNRPALQDLLTKCRDDKSIDAVLIQDTDRLARNTLDHLTIKAILKKVDVEIISISQPMIDSSPEGNLIDTILASVNAFQSQITGRKTSKVLEEKAKLGWYPGGLPPLGYKNVENPKPTCSLDRKIITIDEPTASYIKQVFQEYSTGNHNITNLTEWLRNKGVKSVTGVTLHKSRLADYFREPFYIGKFRWGKKLYQGKHKPLISESLFKLVGQVLDAHNQNASRTRKHNFLLRGFLYCPECDNRLWAEYHNKQNKLYGFYYCYHCRPREYTDMLKLEQAVEKLFTKIELSKEYTKHVLDTAKKMMLELRTNVDRDRQELVKRKSKLTKAIQETEDARFISKTLTEERFNSIYNRYHKELKEVDQQMQGLSSDQSEKVKSLEKLLVLAENIGKTYEKADPRLKRSYLGLFFKKIYIKDNKVLKYKLSPQLEPLIKDGSVRVRTSGLRG
ncbi:hypothetical protein COW99_03770 [Candidatus Roizmanbacteria bacterium CG22_combo_CG10-13_8_21_14_all_38_20]|uniref:Recombinase family protein n=1 Tax=Candidatus Roizmanbacteria bacterium CG22_combo_CG10-13_8_21_14_all_38_20 TaxID=1974862 RepID=A0A2H0BVD9_9BACT|nr:recombinase family protein [Candidatus Microgenomates bacterium]PIP61509.1 MAG: hypothetical protein COW99_03770 [Candidatus Roizmanbacteria bacterium CG22_combo_CG10-13_8_21_14_all_38_20]PJC32275.1 MAG: hypothetical protein CO050_00445 [Candidatus Roizmanbacteria bacterium CG_4_9_14_0_2_um_filter_38_17]